MCSSCNRLPPGGSVFSKVSITSTLQSWEQTGVYMHFYAPDGSDTLYEVQPPAVGESRMGETEIVNMHTYRLTPRCANVMTDHRHSLSTVQRPTLHRSLAVCACN